MKIYLVGGAVRDSIMGLPVHDRDYVVVGSTHEEMISMGFTQVGADFPVYLHPVTKEEYALARTERKTGLGYQGFDTRFTPDVTLEEDLARRDLTINAIAKDLESGIYIDPFDGISDIMNKRLRATSKAFMEDPLRVLRLFRLYSRFGAEWEIPIMTMAQVNRAGKEVAYVSKERKFKELEKAFNDVNSPSVYLDALASWTEELPELGVLSEVPQPPEHHPEGNACIHTLLCVDAAHKAGLKDFQKFAMLCHDLGKVIYFERGTLHGHESYGVPIVENLCVRMGVPQKWKKFAKIVTEHHTRLHGIFEAKPKSVYNLISKVGDVEMVKLFAECCAADSRGRGPTRENSEYPQADFIVSCAQTLVDNKKEISVLSREIAEKWKGNPDMISEQVRALKISFIRKHIQTLRG